MFFKKKLIDAKLPKHIAYIIDGNGRWAKKRGMPRSVGHKFGINTLKNCILDTFDLGIKIISVFGFSTENWNRPKEEIDYLFNLFRDFIKKDLKDIDDNKVKVRIMGDYAQLPPDLVEEINKAVEKTKNNNECILNLGINYGGRDEIITAVNKIIKDGAGKIEKEQFSNYLYTAGLPDPDFIIRTSGEQRISNFMLWQSAYSEFYFPKIYWPDFNKKQLIKSLLEYQKRNRRYGTIK